MLCDIVHVFGSLTVYVYPLIMLNSNKLSHYLTLTFCKKDKSILHKKRNTYAELFTIHYLFY